jgi:hypothetical protein
VTRVFLFGPGIYTFELTVTDPAGASNTKSLLFRYQP